MVSITGVQILRMCFLTLLEKCLSHQATSLEQAPATSSLLYLSYVDTWNSCTIMRHKAIEKLIKFTAIVENEEDSVNARIKKKIQMRCSKSSRILSQPQI